MTEPEATGDVRASDAERARIATLLEEHHAAGRLTVAELDERVAAAYAARTRDDLATLLADLPTEPDPEPVEPLDPRRLLLLCWVCPPAGLVYWLTHRRARTTV
ncbi:MAG TPA: DUF1707 domain-containing protein [Pseudonocardiaceae bacterium]|nr:DUF1707 domain-containing protein [Pseudonocardiaceae bacterium]